MGTRSRPITPLIHPNKQTSHVNETHRKHQGLTWIVIIGCRHWLRFGSTNICDPHQHEFGAKNLSRLQLKKKQLIQAVQLDSTKLISFHLHSCVVCHSYFGLSETELTQHQTLQSLHHIMTVCILCICVSTNTSNIAFTC